MFQQTTESHPKSSVCRTVPKDSVPGRCRSTRPRPTFSQGTAVSTEIHECHSVTSKKSKMSKQSHLNVPLEPSALSATGLTCAVLPSMYLNALEAVSATIISNTSNVLQGAARIIAFPWLTLATTWYLLKTDGVVLPFVFQVGGSDLDLKGLVERFAKAGADTERIIALVKEAGGTIGGLEEVSRPRQRLQSEGRAPNREEEQVARQVIQVINNYDQQNQRHYGPDGPAQRRRITNGETSRTREGDDRRLLHANRPRTPADRRPKSCADTTHTQTSAHSEPSSNPFGPPSNRPRKAPKRPVSHPNPKQFTGAR